MYVSQGPLGIDAAQRERRAKVKAVSEEVSSCMSQKMYWE